MRTLKKTLCLVLCLAMMAGLCVIGTSAAFSDAEEIENKEAVDLLTGLGIIEGYPEGDYKPGKVLNRAEACKIIAYLLLGKEAAEALPEAYPFDDVQGGWASGYISYCKKAGIVAGVNDEKTLFDPDAELTAAAWAKMLLCALGYSDKTEGLLGEAWDLNVTKLVSRTKLAEGMAFLGSDAMTRDSAALLAFNALTVPMVEYANGSSFSVGGATFESEGKREPSGEFLCQKYGLDVAKKADDQKVEAKRALAAGFVETGVVTANSANAADATATVVGDTSYKYESGIELLGHYVRVYKDSKGNVLSLTEIGSVKTVETALDKADDVKAAFGKKGSDVVKGLTSIVKFDAGAVDTAAGAYNITDDAAPAGLYVFDDAGKLVAELLDSYKIVTLEKVGKIVPDEGKETIDLSGAGTLDNGNAKKDVVREYEGIAKDDIVVVTKMGAIYNLAKAETVDGAITKVKSGKITLDGVEYAKSAATNAGAIALADVVDVNTVSLKDTTGAYITFRAYLYEGAYIEVIVKPGETVAATFDPYYLKSDAVVKSTKTYPNADKGDYGAVDVYTVELIDMKGEKVTVEVKDGAAITGLTGGLVLVKAADEKDVTYKKLVAATAADANAVKLDLSLNSALKTDGKTTTKYGGAYVNADTVFYFVSTKDSKTVIDTKTGLFEMESGKPAVLITGKDADNNVIAKTVFVDGAFSAAKPAVSPSTIVYVKDGTAKSERTADGYVYTVYDAIKGEAKEITMAEDKTLAGGFYGFETDSKGITKLDDYAISADVVIGGTYTGKYQSVITVDASEYNGANSVFVDLRAAADVKTKITSVDTLQTEVITNEKVVKLDMLLDAKGVPTIIFVRK